VTRLTAAALVAVVALATVAVAVLATSGLRNSLFAHMPPEWVIQVKALRHGVRVDHGVRIRMADGKLLAASLYRPLAPGAQRVPTVMIRLPYGRLQYPEGYENAIFFAEHGYAALVVDLRGTGDSEGALLPWLDAADDGIRLFDWIGSQAWSDGKVGTFGCSALGETQVGLAARNHVAHGALIASGAGGGVGSLAGRYGYFGVFEGGVFQLASGFGWFVNHGSKDPGAPPAEDFDSRQLLRQLPVISLVQRVSPSPNGYAEFLSIPLDDPRWRDWGYVSDHDRSQVPALWVNTWGDQTVGETLALSQAWQPSDPDQRVVIAPGDHCNHESIGGGSGSWGALEVQNAAAPWQDWYLRWFDRWLRGIGVGLDDLEPYTYYMLDEGRWYGAERWPPPESAVQRWWLASGGRANSRNGNGRLDPLPSDSAAADRYSYDPRDPVPSRGGPVCCTGDPSIGAGPVDQSDVESRDDVLVYTSDVLATDLRIAGPLKAVLSFSSDAPDTDLVARLVDVRPDGTAINIQEGALRLRYRDGFDEPKLMEPDRIYNVTVAMRDIAYRVRKGHRLRLQVTSSSFPRLERNLNTGAPLNAAETAARVAVNSIHHSTQWPSYLELHLLGTAEPIDLR